MGVSGLGGAFLCDPPPGLNAACLSSTGAYVPYCVAPRLGSALPIFGRIFCGSCGRYPYTLRSDWAMLLCCGFGGWYPSYRCPPFILLIDVVATITDAGRSRGPYLAVGWHTDITAT